MYKVRQIINKKNDRLNTKKVKLKIVKDYTKQKIIKFDKNATSIVDLKIE